jgi:hypothetical protein
MTERILPNRLGLIAGLVGFVLLAAGSGSDMSGNGSSKSDLQNPQHTVNYKDLADEFEANSVAAEGKYEGKVIHVQGPIYSIDKDLTGNPYIMLSGEYDIAMIRCEVDESTTPLQSLRKGQVITIGGVVGDTTMGVSLSPCTVVIKPGEQSRLQTPPPEIDKIRTEIDNNTSNPEKELDNNVLQIDNGLDSVLGPPQTEASGN